MFLGELSEKIILRQPEVLEFIVQLIPRCNQRLIHINYRTRRTQMKFACFAFGLVLQQLFSSLLYVVRNPAAVDGCMHSDIMGEAMMSPCICLKPVKDVKRDLSALGSEV